MADTIVEDAPIGTLETHGANGIWGPYWLDDQVGAIVYIDANRDIVARKTTDGGTSWSSAVVMESITCIALAVWFDKQTPGDNGTKLHVVAMNDAADSCRYGAYDISAGTWNTPVETGSYFGVDTANTSYAFIVKARNGQLVVGSVSSASGSGCWKSTSPYTTWTSITGPFESTAVDQVYGFAGNTSDPADIGVLFWDVSANQISLKMFDSSAGTWTETLITGTTFVESAAFKQMCVTMRLSDGHAIAAGWNGFDVATADVDVWDINPNVVAAVPFTTKTQPNANQDNSCMASLFINQINNDIYFIYGEGTNPTVTQHIKYKVSSNGGTSWGTAVIHSDGTQRDYRLIGFSAMSATAGRFQPAWFDNGNVDVLINLDNDIPLPATVSTPATVGGAWGIRGN